MTFQKSKVQEFLNLFNNSKHQIRNFNGCRHLELMKDYHQDNIFTTYSHWDDGQALENYRKSELFNEVWAETKKLFADKPVAFSLKEYIKVDDPGDAFTSGH